jgi:hypothetical protein
MSSECEYCKKPIDREEWCDWNQGRCPRRQKPSLSSEMTILLWTILGGLLGLALLSELLRSL